MVERDLRVSDESIPLLERYKELPRNDPRRAELFGYLAAALADPNMVDFEPESGSSLGARPPN